MYLVFDTETSGFPAAGPPAAHIMQLGAVLLRDEPGLPVEATLSTLVKLPTGAFVHPKAAAVTGLTAELCNANGREPLHVWDEFAAMATRAGAVVGHNIDFDLRMAAEFCRIHGTSNPVATMTSFCTMKLMTPLCRIPGKWRGSFKWPSCTEAYRYVTDGATFDGAHDAMADVNATAEILRWLVERRMVRLPIQARATNYEQLALYAAPAPAPKPQSPSPKFTLVQLLKYVNDKRTANC